MTRSRRALLFFPAAIEVVVALVKATTDWGDFGGYVGAGSAILSGHFSTHPSNTWPPFFSVAAIPLAWLGRLPAVPARIFWASLNAAVFIAACGRWWRAFSRGRAACWVAPAGALVIVPFLAQHMLFHQVYALIFAGLVEAFLAAEEGRDFRAGVWLGVAGALKVTPGLLLPYFLFRRRWKLAATATATAIACSLCLVPFLGFRGALDAHWSWVRRASVLGGTHGIHNQSIEALVYRWTTGDAKREKAGIDPVIPLAGSTAARIGKGLSWLLLIGACFAVRKRAPVDALPALAALSVLAVPYCWRSQYVALGPLILFSLTCLSLRRDLATILLCGPFLLGIIEREPWLIGFENFAVLEGAGLTCILALLLVANATASTCRPEPGALSASSRSAE